MKIYNVQIQNFKGENQGAAWTVLGRSKQAAIRNAARMQGLLVSNRWDKLSEVKQGVFMFESQSKSRLSRNTHDMKFVCTEK